MNSRRGLNLIELQIVIVIIVVLAAAAIPAFVSFSNREKQRSVACLIALAEAAEGDASATCPATGRPLLLLSSAGARIASCPDPQKHLQPESLLRRAGGVTSLSQQLPAASGISEFRQGGCRVTFKNGVGGVTIRLVPDRWWRWILYPFYGFFVGGLAASGVFAVGSKYFRREPEPVAAQFVVMGILWVLATVLVFPAETTIVVAPSSLQVEKRVFGMPWGSVKTYEALTGIAAVKNRQSFVVVALVGTGKDRRGVDLFTVSDEELPVVSRLQRN